MGREKKVGAAAIRALIGAATARAVYTVRQPRFVKGLTKAAYLLVAFAVLVSRFVCISPQFRSLSSPMLFLVALITD